ncbi:MAG TPA: low specificity L-threonine aldolase [Gemmatimonadaceae bacterium]|jgi:threonine aldolase|nr:low specificity L-threonine aldolase [Gemmatimonadaceae bacterium]
MRQEQKSGRAFASDNWAGVHPEVLEAMTAANVGHVPSYGADPYTHDAVSRIGSELGGEPEVFLVFSGTAANVLCLQSMVRSHQAVICAATAHVYTSECGAAEKHIGCKLLPVPSPNGKITVAGIREQLHDIGNEHHAQPRAVSITQATEYGTVYTPQEIRVIADFAHANSLLLHMDGARIFNAAAYLNVPLKAITSDAGVDALSFGGTKNGLVAGEAAVFFKRVLADDFEFRRMQGMQLSSKMRFIAAQFSALLTNGLWKRSAEHANKMAQLLASELAGIQGVALTQAVEANEVFVTLPRQIVPKLQEQWPFHIWNEGTSEARLITSFDTEESDVADFARRVREAIGSKEKQWT